MTERASTASASTTGDESEFLEPLGITAYQLSKDISVPQTRVAEIIAGRRGLSADTALRLARYFGTSAEFWLNRQWLTTSERRSVLTHVAARLWRNCTVHESSQNPWTHAAVCDCIARSQGRPATHTLPESDPSAGP